MAPESAALEADTVAVEQGEALAGRSAHDDVDLGEVVDVLDRPLGDVIAEVLAIRRGRVGIDLDGEDRRVAAGVDESAGHASAAGEEVHETQVAAVSESSACRHVACSVTGAADGISHAHTLWRLR